MKECKATRNKVSCAGTTDTEAHLFVYVYAMPSAITHPGKKQVERGCVAKCPRVHDKCVYNSDSVARNMLHKQELRNI